METYETCDWCDSMIVGDHVHPTHDELTVCCSEACASEWDKEYERTWVEDSGFSLEDLKAVEEAMK